MKPPPPDEDSPDPIRVTPKRVADQLHRIGEELGRIQLRIRTLSPYLDRDPIESLHDQVRTAAARAVDLGSAVRVGQMPLVADYVDLAAGRGPRPIIDRIEDVGRGGGNGKADPVVPTAVVPATLHTPPATPAEPKRKKGRQEVPTDPDPPAEDDWREVLIADLAIDVEILHEVASTEMATLGELADFLTEDGFRDLTMSTELYFSDAEQVLAALCLWWLENRDGPLPFRDHGDCAADREKTQVLIDWLKRKRSGDIEPQWDRWSEFEVTLEDGSPVAVVFEAGSFNGGGHFDFYGPLTSTGYRSLFLRDVDHATPIVEFAQAFARRMAAEKTKEAAKEARAEKRAKKAAAAKPEPPQINRQPAPEPEMAPEISSAAKPKAGLTTFNVYLRGPHPDRDPMRNDFLGQVRCSSAESAVAFAAEAFADQLHPGLGPEEFLATPSDHQPLDPEEADRREKQAATVRGKRKPPQKSFDVFARDDGDSLVFLGQMKAKNLDEATRDAPAAYGNQEMRGAEGTPRLILGADLVVKPTPATTAERDRAYAPEPTAERPKRKPKFTPSIDPKSWTEGDTDKVRAALALAPDQRDLYTVTYDPTGDWHRCHECSGDYDHPTSAIGAKGCHRNRLEVAALAPCSARNWEAAPLDELFLYRPIKQILRTNDVETVGQLEAFVRGRWIYGLHRLSRPEADLVLEELAGFKAKAVDVDLVPVEEEVAP